MLNPAHRIGTESWQVTNEIDSINVGTVLDLSKIGRELIVEKIRKYVGECMRIGLITLDQTRIFKRVTADYTDYFIDTSDPIFKGYLTSTEITVASVYIDFRTTGYASESFFNQDILDGILKIYYGNHYI